MPRVTVLTDFGTRDGYAAAMKGVLACRVPGLAVDDVSHEVAQGDVRGAARALGRYWKLYPEGTVHLVVVDPGVGTDRRAMACRADGRFVVAPDNGVVTRVLAEASGWRGVELRDAEPPGGLPLSATFHGRDVFAPAAARLAAGEPLESLGPPLNDPVRLEEPLPERLGRGGRGVVVAVDRFGNLLTNVPGEWLSEADAVEIEGTVLPVVRTYGDVAPGAAAALVSSDGRVEVAVRDGSAQALTGAGVGAEVRLRGP